MIIYQTKTNCIIKYLYILKLSLQYVFIEKVFNLSIVCFLSSFLMLFSIYYQIIIYILKNYNIVCLIDGVIK